ncbi:hypothetical protein VTN00DRAFT_4380 [Thermoascus crustaceus]|uniref:uncharacterized protein n=1 Tax=Thermoascus crustaceus TaxID=5088 RepID=UPI0037435808
MAATTLRSQSSLLLCSWLRPRTAAAGLSGPPLSTTTHPSVVSRGYSSSSRYLRTAIGRRVQTSSGGRVRFSPRTVVIERRFGGLAFTRGYADLKPPPGKTEADLLVEEIQELYDAAKDEFEIAVDSTNAATIYAASDRASARDALNHLVRVYTLYTEMTTSSAPDTPAAVHVPEGGTATAPVPKEPVAQQKAAEGRTDPLTTGDPAAGPPLRGEDTESVVGITPNYNPEEISQEVREEVKRRVGQRVRELKNAVEALEERASAE